MTYALVLAAGKGERIKSNLPKQLMKIFGKTVLEYTLDVFETCGEISKILLVISEEFSPFAEELVKRYSKLVGFTIGGKTRRESSYMGLKHLNASEDDIVIIHDAVRPFIDCDLIESVVKAAEKFGASSAAVKSVDTIVEVDEDGFFSKAIERRKIRRVQTPQAFKYSIIMKAHEMATSEKGIDDVVTDDCGLVLRYGLSKVKAVEGREWNVKITYPFDLEIAKLLVSNGIVGGRGAVSKKVR